MDDKLLQDVALLPGVFLAFAIRERVRRCRANERLTIGLAGLSLTLLGLLAVFQLLPPLRPTDPSIAFYTLEFAVAGFVGGSLVFSLVEIAGGSIRILNRRQHLHRD